MRGLNSDQYYVGTTVIEERQLVAFNVDTIDDQTRRSASRRFSTSDREGRAAKAVTHVKSRPALR